MDIDFEQTLKHKDCLSKYVSVKTVDKKTHEGWLKTIDPLTGNLILVSFSDDKLDATETVLIMGSACKSVDVLKEADEKMKCLIRDLYACQSYSPTEDLSDRKEQLTAWIKTNRLPVYDMDGTLVVCESVTIHPPYNAESCNSSNGRILTKIRNLVTSMPTVDTTEVSEVSVKTEITSTACESTD